MGRNSYMNTLHVIAQAIESIGLECGLLNSGGNIYLLTIDIKNRHFFIGCEDSIIVQEVDAEGDALDVDRLWAFDTVDELQNFFVIIMRIEGV